MLNWRYTDLPLDAERLNWWAEREASLFAEKCAESRVDRAATADEAVYIRKQLGYSRNFTILLGPELHYHLYKGMPVESNRHATSRCILTSSIRSLGFPILFFLPPQIF
jgi:hypothetical protein